jgi:hypothetical protein
MATRRRRTKLFRGRSRSRRHAQMSGLSGIWFAVAAVCGVLTVFLESITLCVVCLVALTAAVISMFSPEAGQIASRAAVPAKAGNTKSGPTPGGRRPASKSAAKPGTVGRKPPCGARCRRSTKDKKTCDCICRGSAHGSEVGRTYTGSRAELQSKQLKAQERAHVKEHEPWNTRSRRSS